MVLKTSIEVNQGNIQGKLETYSDGEYVSFKGIPYAKPPIGQLRFAQPHPPEKWEGIYDATKHRNICPQSGPPTFQLSGNEDCLYLNVYTPNVKNKYPVLIFIPGGAFLYGSGDSELYGVEYFMPQDIVVVTINYRVNVLGFLCVDTDDVPGNAGLKDQVAAIKWVKENIVHFGGDSNNITLMGRSAGSASVSYHLFSPLTRDLFHAAILQSGVCTSKFAIDDDPVNRAFNLGRILGCKTKNKDELIEFLRSVPIPDLIEAAKRTQNDNEKQWKTEILFRPVIEKESTDAFITEPIDRLLKSGKFHDVPVIIGYNSGEGILNLRSVIRNMDEINDDFETFVAGLIQTPIKKEFASNLKQFYFDGQPFHGGNVKAMVNLRGDAIFCYDIYKFGKRLSATFSSSVYFYLFDCNSELNIFAKLNGGGDLNLACHGDDTFYMFSTKLFNLKKVDITNRAGKMVQNMVTILKNMMIHRNPTPDSAQWKPMTKDVFNYVLISDELQHGTNPRQERMEFWDKLYIL